MFSRRRLVSVALVATAVVAVFALAARPWSARAASASCVTSQLKLYAGPLKVGLVPVVFIHGITGDPSIFTNPGPHHLPIESQRSRERACGRSTTTTTPWIG
jgi:pimeloyl-ACP methyl ester carboxylesterase